MTSCDTKEAPERTCRQVALPPMHQARYAHAAVKIDDHRLLVIGGFDGTRILRSTELYDKRTNKWTRWPSLKEMRWDPAAVLCNSKVYVFGGRNQASIEYLDVSEPTEWKTLNQCLSSEKCACAAVTVGSLVYIMGGTVGLSCVSSVDILDTKTNKLRQGPSMVKKRSGCGAAVVDDIIYVVGGVDERGKRLKTMEAFLPSIGQWQLCTTSMSTERQRPAVTVLRRCLVIVGGQDNSNNELSSVDVFDTKRGIMISLPDMERPRYGCAAVTFGHSHIHVMGGFGDGSYHASMHTMKLEMNGDGDKQDDTRENQQVCTHEAQQGAKNDSAHWESRNGRNKKEQVHQADSLIDEGLNLLEDAKYPEALVKLKEASHLKPKDTRIWAGMASCHEQLLQYGEMAMAARIWVETDPKAARGQYQLAVACQKLSDREGAQTAIEAAQKILGKEEDEREWTEQERLGRIEQEQTAKEARSPTEGDENDRPQKQASGGQSDRPEEQEQISDQLEHKKQVESERSITRVDSIVAEANEALSNAKYGRALRSFREVSRLRPEDAQVWACIALCHKHLFQFDDMAAAAEKCVQINPIISQGHYSLAMAHWKQENRLEALIAVEAGLKVLPQDESLVDLKQKLEEQKRHEEKEKRPAQDKLHLEHQQIADRARCQEEETEKDQRQEEESNEQLKRLEQEKMPTEQDRLCQKEQERMATEAENDQYHRVEDFPDKRNEAMSDANHGSVIGHSSQASKLVPEDQNWAKRPQEELERVQSERRYEVQSKRLHGEEPGQLKPVRCQHEEQERIAQEAGLCEESGEDHRGLQEQQRLEHQQMEAEGCQIAQPRTEPDEPDQTERQETARARRHRPVYDNGRIAATKRLKRSGQATIWRGTMTTKNGFKQDIAIKVYKSKKDWDVCRRELKLLLGVSHPNVMEVLEFFEVPKPCFVMRFIAGGDLRHHLNKRGRFVGDDAVQLLRGIGDGLLHLHEHNIVHRHMKSPNILLEGTGSSMQPVLIDFGLGKRTKANMREPQLTSCDKGTTRWTAPEMLMSRRWSTETDMYSLGVIMWEVLTGELPYADKGASYQIVYHVTVENGRPSMSALAKVGVSLAHRDIIVSLWHSEPSLRPSAEDFITLLGSRMPTDKAVLL